MHKLSGSFWSCLACFLPFHAIMMVTARVCPLGIIFVLSSFCFALLASGQLTDPLEVSALQEILRKLEDPEKNLNDWEKTDPCVSNWTGVFCITDPSDGYLHVQELRMLNLNLSGNLAPELGQLSYLTILNFLWNNISGSIPKEIGNLNYLMLLLLSGNQLSGPLPDELGFLSNLKIFQLDRNNISGPLPKTFANLTNAKHFHMNDNSISGQIPPELSALGQLLHFLLDNNNLSGYLPPELSKMPNLKIIQLDNNNFQGTVIPDSYRNMSKLVKLSLRNCSLQGSIPDLSGIASLTYIDLSSNKLTGGIPTNKFSDKITTINLPNNMLNGSIPSNFSLLPRLQRLSLENNLLSGNVPSIWQNMTFSADAKLHLDFQNNSLSDISDSLDPPSNVTLRLQGNPICRRENELNIVQFCALQNDDEEAPGNSSNSDVTCPPQSCPASAHFEYVPASPVSCFCALPLGVGIRLRSPSISDFRPYIPAYETYITTNISLDLYQLYIDSFMWEKGPRLRLFLKFFPQYSSSTNEFNKSEVQHIVDMIATFSLSSHDTFGPYELLNFTLLGPYKNVYVKPLKSGGMSKGVLIGIVLGAISCVVAISAAIMVLFYKKHTGHQKEVSKKQPVSKIQIKTESVKGFSFVELEAATRGFIDSSQIGQGGYGKVYKGILANGTVVAIKRAQEGSLQGEREFFTEIELLSRLHHRNLAPLVGYCDEEGEQMLVYEFMPNGSLHDLLSARFTNPLSFAMRLNIAMGSAKGILYLHIDADPPIIHRDIKANNILLDFKFTAKVSDFGISRLAPVPDGEGLGTHISTVVKGTPGYLDPDYFLTHQLTEKSDVYSLGIVFLELLTGMQPISHGRNIVREVNAACQSGKMFSIIDRKMGPYSSECVKKFMALALKCCQEETKARPSMLEVVRELENICAMLPESDTILSDSDASTSGTSGFASSSLYNKRESYASTEFPGSNLVSGVIPTIRPR